MRITFTFLLCLGFLLGSQSDIYGQKKSKAQRVIVQINSESIDKKISELMANRISPVKIETEELALATLEYKTLISAENLMFPADELYNSNWDTLHVDPFAKSTIDFPESYTIDCHSFIIPIENELKITSKYGPRGRRMHRGIDLKVKIGDTIRAAFDGKVRLKSYEKKGYGYYMVLRHPNGLETVYGHLSKFIATENQIVRAGEPIALGGNTGRSSGSHLHFETRFLGKDINPAEIIDFVSGTPHKDEYVFHNIKINGKKTNIYSTSADAIAVHRVKKGETLSHIARNYGTTVTELCKLNGIKSTSTLSVGQGIQVRSKQVTVEASTNSIKQSSTAKKIEVPAQGATTSKDGHIYHTIESGDTLFSIAKKYNTTIEKLCELNEMKENVIIKTGQKIRCS